MAQILPFRGIRAASWRKRERPLHDRRSWLPVLLVAVLGSPLALATSEDIDTDLMQSIEDTTKSVTSNIDLHRLAAADEDARTLDQLLGQVQAYYEAHPDKPDALGYARASRDLARRLSALVVARDFEHASTVAADLSRSCRTCHDVYKHDT